LQICSIKSNATGGYSQVLTTQYPVRSSIVLYSSSATLGLL